ncbi:MAG: hypothetical protein M3O99_04360, partial [Chloroflexota bacterium]|nr:hypothetical protein [Chloroflexota bacterium]
MRRLVGVALAVVLTSCGPAAVAPPTDAPAAAPTAAPTAVAPYAARNPDDQPATTAPPPPTAPVAPTPQVQVPRVGLVSQAFPFTALPVAGSATADELQLTQQNLQGWTTWFAQMLTGYQGLYAADTQKQVELKAGFETMVAPGPFAEVLKIWALRDASDSRKFTTSDATILKLYAKPWGRAAYADMAFKLIESGGAQDSTRNLRVRVTVGRSWRVIDAWDTNTARWLLGETPQYSALT